MISLHRLSLWTAAMLALAAFGATASTTYYEPAPSIAAMEALGSSSATVLHVTVASYTLNANDGGGGNFNWDAGSTTTPDNCMVFAATGVTTGRWIREKILPMSIGNCGGGPSIADNTSATTSALATLGALGGGTFLIDRPGTYNFLPSSAVTGYFSIPANVNIQCGAGTELKINNANEVDTWFQIRNTAGNSFIYDCHFYGNSVSTNSSGAGAVMIAVDGSATVDMKYVGCVRCFVENFKEPYWVEVLNTSVSHTISNVSFDGLHCKSYSGNLFSTNVVSSCIITFGQEANAAGTIKGVSVRDAYGEDGTYLTSFYAGFNASDVIIDHGVFRNFAQSQTNVTFATRTLFSYELLTGFSTRPQNFTLSNSYLYNSPGNHVYCYLTDACHIENNVFDTLPDLAGVPAELPAAVRFSDSEGDATGNTFINGSNPDIRIAMIDGKTINIVNNIGSSSTTPTNGTNSAVVIGSGQIVVGDGTGIVNLINNSFSRTGGTSGQSLSLVTDTTHGLGHVNVIGGRWMGSGYAVFGSDSNGTGSVITAGISFSGFPFIQGYYAGIDFISLSKPLYMDGVIIDGSNAATSGWPLQLYGATNLNLDNVTLQNIGSSVGPATDMRNSCGSVRGFQFHNATPGQYGNTGQPGLSAPTCTGQPGWFFQNFAPSGTGHLFGWTWASGAWVEQ